MTELCDFIYLSINETGHVMNHKRRVLVVKFPGDLISYHYWKWSRLLYMLPCEKNWRYLICNFGWNV